MFYLNSNTQDFFFSQRLFAKHHILSTWCRILSSRSRSRVYCCHSDIDFTKNCILTDFIVSHCSKFCGVLTRIKSHLRRLKNIGMVSQKLYRNTLLSKFSSHSLLIEQTASYKRTLKIDPATPNDMNSLPIIQITYISCD